MGRNLRQRPLPDAGPDTARYMIHAFIPTGSALAALVSIRQARPNGRRIYVILDSLTADTTPAIRTWATANRVEMSRPDVLAAQHRERARVGSERHRRRGRPAPEAA